MGKIKEFFINLFKMDNEQNKRKNIEKIIIIAIIGLLLMVAANYIFIEPENNKNTNNSIDTEIIKNITESNTDLLSEKIKDILSKVKGAGEVDVLITYKNGEEIQIAYDSKTTDDRSIDTNDGNTKSNSARKEEDKQAVLSRNSDGSDSPIIINKITPQVMGVLIVADGGDDASVIVGITKAVQALTGVPAHRITILKRQE